MNRTEQPPLRPVILGFLLAAVCLVSLSLTGILLADSPSTPADLSIPWLPSLGITFSLRLDGFSLLFLFLISGIGALVFAYSGSYIRAKGKSTSLLGILFLFFLAMCGLVAADDLILLFIFWELTSICSFLLIGTDHFKEEARKAATQAFLVTAGGGLCLLAALLHIGAAAGTFRISEILEGGALAGNLPAWVLCAVVIAAATKSAQIPFHSWLPRGMAAPAPVSAFLHSATMVKAGIFLLARLNPLFNTDPLWSQLLVPLGAATMLYGAVLAICFPDLKRLLAYSTISALGVLVSLIGIGSQESMKAALVFLTAHSLYKAGLFMVVGLVEHSTGSRDGLELHGLYRSLPLTCAAALLCGLSMIGAPPLIGFLAKELMYEAKIDAVIGGAALPAVTFLTSVFTVAAAAMVSFFPYFRRKRSSEIPVQEIPVPLLIGPLFLGVLSLAIGFFPQFVADAFFEPALIVLAPETTEVKLKLWHGVNPVLIISIAALLLGVILAYIRTTPSVQKACDFAVGALPPGPRVFDSTLSALLRLGERSLSIFPTRNRADFVRIALVGFALYFGLLLYWQLPAESYFSRLHLSTSLDWLNGAFLVLSCIGALKSRTHLAALLWIGAAGVALTVIFSTSGAPDLALTQLLVEMFILLAFAFLGASLLRKRLEKQRAAPSEYLLSLFASGALITFLLVTPLAEKPTELTRFFGERTLIEAGGANIVNVILVDFRALDTMGEVLVVIFAALGIHWLRKQWKEQEG